MARGSPIAGIGIRARTARAVFVAVGGTTDSPRAVTRAAITLATPATPTLFQPYHQVMSLPWERARAAVESGERALEAVATSSLKAFLLDLRARGLDPRSVAIVGAPERNLGSIGSSHIRAHAAEGVLFRRVWQVAAAALAIPSTAFPEKAFEPLAATGLRLSVDAVRTRIAEFGTELGRPWRADEKAAAMAAWLALTTDGTA